MTKKAIKSGTVRITENAPWLNVRRLKGNEFRITTNDRMRDVKLKMAPKISLSVDDYSSSARSPRDATSMDTAQQIESMLPSNYRAVIGRGGRSIKIVKE